jgi:hypothetical protein
MDPGPHFSKRPLRCARIVNELSQRTAKEGPLINILMSPPYVKSNKNDARDAEAICKGVVRPSMCFVTMKS